MCRPAYESGVIDLVRNQLMGRLTKIGKRQTFDHSGWCFASLHSSATVFMKFFDKPSRQKIQSLDSRQQLAFARCIHIPGGAIYPSLLERLKAKSPFQPLTIHSEIPLATVGL